MANTILNIHFDYWNTSLKYTTDLDTKIFWSIFESSNRRPKWKFLIDIFEFWHLRALLALLAHFGYIWARLGILVHFGQFWELWSLWSPLVTLPMHASGQPFYIFCNNKMSPKKWEERRNIYYVLNVSQLKWNQKSLNAIYFWGQEVNIWAAASDHGGVALH